jgi:glycosyltransferase involved in cell wall biosynthesis
MVGPPPRRKDVIDALSAVPSAGQVQFFQGVNNETLQAAYSVAKAFLFPSLAEGFGWPIIEAQACGCPVVTTDDAPMNEIGGPDAIYLPVLKAEDDILQWAQSSATALSALLAGDSKDEASRVSRRMDWASRFTQDAAIEGYLAVYRSELGLP